MMTKVKFLSAAILLSATGIAPAWPKPAITTAITGPRRSPTRSATCTITARAGLPGTFAYDDGPSTVHCAQSAAAYLGQDRRRHPCF